MPTTLPNLRVVDFSRVLAGPFAAMMLGDLGADVVKIEAPNGGDETRGWGPPFDESGQSTYFQSVNRNKRSVVLDLASAYGHAKALDLVAKADVVLENFRPGVMAKLGLSYEAVNEINPSVVYCSITGFGAGAGAALPGYDLLIQGLGGLMSITGDPDGEPQKVGVALIDVLAGLFSTVGILAALAHRNRTGLGQRVEVNLLLSLLSALTNQATAYTSAGVVPQRMGNRHPSIAPYELLGCADRELIVAVGNDKQFRALCEVLGVAELGVDSRFASNQARVENRVQLRSALSQALAARPAEEWADSLTAAGVPAGVINDIAAAFALAQSLGLDPIVDIQRSDGTAVSVPRNPIGLSLTPPQYLMAPPTYEP